MADPILAKPDFYDVISVTISTASAKLLAYPQSPTHPGSRGLGWPVACSLSATLRKRIYREFVSTICCPLRATILQWIIWPRPWGILGDWGRDRGRALSGGTARPRLYRGHGFRKVNFSLAKCDRG